MKKKKVILIIILIPALLLCGALAAYVVMVQRYGEKEVRRWYYEEGYPQFLDFLGKRDFWYKITVRSEQGILFDNGEKEKEVRQQDYWGYANWRSSYEPGGQGGRTYYYITMYEGDEYTITAKDNGNLDYVGLYVWFYEYETVCRDLQMFIDDVSLVHMEFKKDYIRCVTGGSMGNPVIVLNLNYPECVIRQFSLDELNLNIDAFEIRKEKDGPMVYLDLDKDDIYEYSCKDCIFINEDESKAK